MLYAQMKKEMKMMLIGIRFHLTRWINRKILRKKVRPLFYWNENFYHYNEDTILFREKGEETYKEYELIELIPLNNKN